MAKWCKKTFIEHINKSCENDVAINCLQLIDFSEKILMKLHGVLEMVMVQ
jgi:hypothetical protein